MTRKKRRFKAAKRRRAIVRKRAIAAAMDALFPEERFKAGLLTASAWSNKLLKEFYQTHPLMQVPDQRGRSDTIKIMRPR